MKISLNHFVVFLLIAVSGFAAFFTFKPILWIFSSFTIILFILLKGQYNAKLALILILLTIVQLIQTIIFDFFPIQTYLGMYIRIFFAYSVISITGKKYMPIFLDIMQYLSVISLIFFLPSLIDINFHHWLIDTVSPIFNFWGDYYEGVYWRRIPTHHIVIYAMRYVPTESVIRNCGPFWEPGAFGGYLIISLMFNIIISKSLINKKNVLFIICLITTFSTANYIALLMLIIFYFALYRNNLVKYIVLSASIFVAYQLYFSLDFLHTKINQQINMTGVDSTGQNRYDSVTRFTSALLDLYQIRQNPIVGLGRSQEKRVQSWDDDKNVRNNGLTMLFLMYGIPLSLLFFISYYHNFKQYCIYWGWNRGFAIYMLFLTMLIGFSEAYYLTPFFLSLHFVDVPLKRENKNGLLKIKIR